MIAGELFTYLSPGFASGVIAGGPFGVNQTPPWVNSQVCAVAYANCPGGFENPWGTTLGPPPSGNPADLVLPNATAISEGRAAVLLRRLQSRQQATLHAQRHARYSMAAAPRPGYRHRLRRQSRPPLKSFPCLSIRLRLPRQPAPSGRVLSLSRIYLRLLHPD